MFELSIRSNIKDIERKVSRLAFQQIPFATTLTLNRLVSIVQTAEVKNEQAVLDRPTPFTTRSIRVKRATKGARVAEVVMQGIAAKYLDPYQFGGKNVLNSKALLVPIAAAGDLNQYGNLPRNLLKSLKGRSDIFIGPVKTKAGVVSGVWQRITVQGGHALVQRGGRLVKTRKGLHQAQEGTTAHKLKLLIRFEDAHPAKQFLDWFGVAQGVINKNFNREFGKALALAIATAK